MLIKFYGTSHGAPEKNRFCSGILLKSDRKAYILDCGAPIDALMMNDGFAIEDIAAVFITHMHEDHCGCLTSVIKNVSNYHRPKEKVKFFLPEQKGIDGIHAWMRVLHLSREVFDQEYVVTHDGVIYKDETIQVSAIPTDHIFGFPTYAYLFETEGKKVLFTGDLKSDFSDFPEIAHKEKLDAVVCEFTHIDFQKALSTLKECKTNRIIFTHIYPETYKRHKHLIKELPYPAVFAADGESFEL